MADDSLPDRPEPDRGPLQRPLAGDERELLHRVLRMVKDAPGYAGTIGAGLPAAIGDATRPQEGSLTAAERADLGGVIRRLVEEWEGPRLFREPTPAWDLSGADIARLGLILGAVSPPSEDAGDPLVVNAADWAPPEPVPDGWIVANAPRPIWGPASARAWEGEDRHGRFYAAWPAGDDDGAYWEESGAREVLLLSNQEIAGHAGRYLAACGLLPGEGGLTATEVARRLGRPWKEGVLDDEQAQGAALAAILELRRDDEHLAYDGWSHSPQRRELTGAERAFLSRLAGQAAADPRWGGEQVGRHAGIRAALGDGSRPQARPLTARERDDIGRMVMLIEGEYRYDRQRPGDQPLSPWMAELTGADVARFRLIDCAITPRHGDRVVADQVFVNAADWAPPEPVPDGWVIANAPVPLSGPVTWQDDHGGYGNFYAAAPPGSDPFGAWHAESDGTARPVKTATDEEAVEAAYAFLAHYQCTAPEEAGMTIAEVARDLGYPLPPGRADAAVTAAGKTIRTWVLTPIERSVLRVMLHAHESGMDWLGLTNIAIPAALSLDETATALAKPVKLDYVEQCGKRGGIYQLTGEGRRIAAARPGSTDLDFPQPAPATSPQPPGTASAPARNVRRRPGGPATNPRARWNRHPS